MYFLGLLDACVSLGLHNTEIQQESANTTANGKGTNVLYFIFIKMFINLRQIFVTDKWVTDLHGTRPEPSIFSGKPIGKPFQSLRLKLPSSLRALQSFHIIRHKFTSTGHL